MVLKRVLLLHILQIQSLKLPKVLIQTLSKIIRLVNMIRQYLFLARKKKSDHLIPKKKQNRDLLIIRMITFLNLQKAVKVKFLIRLMKL